MVVVSPNSVVAGRYLLKRLIGGGGMGAVWLAEHVELRAPCAIKLIDGEAARNPEFRRRFTREARAAALLRSAHVVQVLDSGEWRGQPYLVMELLEGEDLRECLLRASRLPPGESVEIARQIARALTKAHAAGIVHRDLKPANVFLTRDDDRLLVKVLDFGIAKYADSDLDSTTQTGTVLGTPHYMSPEQCRGASDIDYRSDLWSLAVIVFECLTGTRPFPGPQLVNLVHQIAVGELPRPTVVRRGLPAALDDWWLRAAERDPARRFQSAREMVEALARALDVPAFPSSTSDPASLASGRRSFSSAPPLDPAVPPLDPTVPQPQPQPRGQGASRWSQTLKGTGALPAADPNDALALLAPPPLLARPLRPLPPRVPTLPDTFLVGDVAPTKPSARIAILPGAPEAAAPPDDGVHHTPPGHTTDASALSRSEIKPPPPRFSEGARSLARIALGAAALLAAAGLLPRVLGGATTAAPPAGAAVAPPPPAAEPLTAPPVEPHPAALEPPAAKPPAAAPAPADSASQATPTPPSAVAATTANRTLEPEPPGAPAARPALDPTTRPAPLPPRGPKGAAESDGPGGEMARKTAPGERALAPDAGEHVAKSRRTPPPSPVPNVPADAPTPGATLRHLLPYDGSDPDGT
jgi:serine/threonine-protein kinase